AKALATLDAIRSQLLKVGNARLFQIASAATQATLTPAVQTLASALTAGSSPKATYATAHLIDDRLRERDPSAVKPVFVGLLKPNSQSGVFLNSAPLAGWQDTDRSKLLDLLGAYLY